MRHHWGLDVGHLHAHQSASSCIPRESTDIDPLDELHVDPESGGEDTYTAEMDGDESDNLEMSLGDREWEGWEDVESETSEDGANDSDNNSEDDNGIYS